MLSTKFRISGHETFPLRFAWLPKCLALLADQPDGFSNDDDAMVTLGVGKNMVRSIRFWAAMTGMIHSPERGTYVPTALGEAIFGSNSDGFDPYMEDLQTIWLLHWKLSTIKDEPLLAWHMLSGRWQEPELAPSPLISRGKKLAEETDTRASNSSLKGHFTVFFHTYAGSRVTRSSLDEESLDSPLALLNLLEFRYQRKNLKGKLEPVYAFRGGRRPELSDELFSYAILDYWRQVSPNEQTLSFQNIAHAPGSPGQVFKLSDQEVRERLERVSGGRWFDYSHSSLIQALQRKVDLDEHSLFDAIEEVYA